MNSGWRTLNCSLPFNVSICPKRWISQPIVAESSNRNQARAKFPFTNANALCCIVGAVLQNWKWKISDVYTSVTPFTQKRTLHKHTYTLLHKLRLANLVLITSPLLPQLTRRKEIVYEFTFLRFFIDWCSTVHCLWKKNCHQVSHCFFIQVVSTFGCVAK